MTDLNQPIPIYQPKKKKEKKRWAKKKTKEIFNQTTHLTEFLVLVILNISIKNLLALWNFQVYWATISGCDELLSIFVPFLLNF